MGCTEFHKTFKFIGVRAITIFEKKKSTKPITFYRLIALSKRNNNNNIKVRVFADDIARIHMNLLFFL